MFEMKDHRYLIGESNPSDMFEMKDQRTQFLSLILLETFSRSGNHFIHSCIKLWLRQLVNNRKSSSKSTFSSVSGVSAPDNISGLLLFLLEGSQALFSRYLAL
jgi:hypothetical protein